jgi:hypothetical protein
VEQAQELVEIMRTKENLTTLCGLSGEETELNFSSQRMGAGDAVLITNDIKENGGLLVLSLKDNSLCAAGTKALGEGLKGNRTITELDLAVNAMGKVSGAWDAKSDMSGVIALADAVADMRAMTSLNLASNELMAQGAKIVAEAIKVTKCTPAIILAPFSCPSDFSINCCCLLLSAGYGGDGELESFRQQPRHFGVSWWLVQYSWG